MHLDRVTGNLVPAVLHFILWQVAESELTKHTEPITVYITLACSFDMMVEHKPGKVILYNAGSPAAVLNDYTRVSLQHN